MAKMSAEFATRREAEMAVEHLVQQHKLDRKAVTITTASAENSVGTEPSGADVKDGHGHEVTDAQPALGGKLVVSVEAADALSDKVRSSFESCGGVIRA